VRRWARSTTSLCRRQIETLLTHGAVTAGLGLRLQLYGGPYTGVRCPLDLDGTPWCPVTLQSLHCVCIAASSTLSWNEAGVIYTHPDCTEVCPLACLQATHVTTCSMTRGNKDRRYRYLVHLLITLKVSAQNQFISRSVRNTLIRGVMSGNTFAFIPHTYLLLFTRCTHVGR
jgi:hypothetical protein